ncbi:hypothetical protein [Congregibacter litoralis]|uniref:Glycoside hydrolase family 42 N-terminal domain-containing protein n=1 Tax=Congregibacter litoralis KT71 TaxID=314285 RepID=A4AE61_9GAMM|nr:hypothetical protein [Congregibacter litoralis]EAQ95706.1 hypothetical protein KT71_19774 [Congregibacter litoralis KT71]
MLPWRRFRRPEFVIAAHYFSDGWPLDSLQVMRKRTLGKELRQLRKDGFNTIIVVVPWRNFQATQQPVAYDDFHQAQLRLVLAAAQGAGLAVLLRVGYTHQVMRKPVLNGFRWAQSMLTDPAIESAWLDYFAEIDRITRDYECCIGGFISWEELWHAFRVWQEQSGEANSAAAKASGYLEYLEARGIEHDGRIPPKDSAAHAHYLSFVNSRMATMFERARSHWPALGVEYRVDKDPVPTSDGIHWRDNEQFLDWEPHRYSYWAPFMGAENVGEALSAEQAEVLLRYMLETTSEGGLYPGQIVEQFNFIDNTQKYLGTHAKIADEQIDGFLEQAAPLFRRYAGGYGLWASRDYRMSMLYNGALLDDCRGWVLSDDAQARKSGGVRLQKGARLRQRIEPRVTWVQRNHPTREVILEVEYLRWRGLGASQLRARLNQGAWASCEADSKGRLIARVPADLQDVFDNGVDFEIENLGRSLTVTRVFLYYETYTAGVRDTNGGEGRFLEAIRHFNARLLEPEEPEDEEHSEEMKSESNAPEADHQLDR